MLLTACPASILDFCISLRHLKLPFGTALAADVEFELCEANVRRAMRGAALFSSVFVTPAASLHGADMVGNLLALLRVVRRGLERCEIVAMDWKCSSSLCAHGLE
jgi:hypothetical protein